MSSWIPACYIRGLIHEIGRGVPNVTIRRWVRLVHWDEIEQVTQEHRLVGLIKLLEGELDWYIGMKIEQVMVGLLKL